MYVGLRILASVSLGWLVFAGEFIFAAKAGLSSAAWFPMLMSALCVTQLAVGHSRQVSRFCCLIAFVLSTSLLLLVAVSRI
jgi:hypothetical protein